MLVSRLNNLTVVAPLFLACCIWLYSTRSRTTTSGGSVLPLNVVHRFGLISQIRLLASIATSKIKVERLGLFIEAFTDLLIAALFSSSTGLTYHSLIVARNFAIEVANELVEVTNHRIIVHVR